MPINLDGHKQAAAGFGPPTKSVLCRPLVFFKCFLLCVPVNVCSLHMACPCHAPIYVTSTYSRKARLPEPPCWGVWGRGVGSIPSSGPRSERRAGPRAHLTPLFLPMLSSRGRPFCPTPAPVWTRHADAPRRVGEKGESLGSLPSPSAFISRVECSPARPGPTPPKAGAVLPAQRALRGRRVHVPCPCSLGCVSSRPQPPRLARSASSETAFSVSRGGPHALSPGPSGGPD